MNAADDVDAAENFFGEEKKEKPPEPKPQNNHKLEAKIANLEREKKKLQQTLEITKRTQKIELQHAKKKAVEMSEQMLS